MRVGIALGGFCMNWNVGRKKFVLHSIFLKNQTDFLRFFFSFLHLVGFCIFSFSCVTKPCFLAKFDYCMSIRRRYRKNFEFNDFQSSVLQKEKRKPIRSMLQICLSVYLFVFCQFSGKYGSSWKISYLLYYSRTNEKCHNPTFCLFAYVIFLDTYECKIVALGESSAYESSL